MSLKSNLKWVTLSRIVQIVLQLISLTVLTRLLAPSEYGLMAMAMVVTNFSLIVRDLGTADAIIQRKTIDQEIKSTIFWLNIIMGACIALIIVICSPLIANLFDELALIPVLMCLTLSFPISSLGTAHKALLERESHFKTVAAIEICSATIALAVALILAYKNYGVYSLVGQTLTNCLISSLFLWRSTKWLPSLIFSKSQLKKVLGFSGNLTAFNLINYFSRNSDAMIIGHYFSTAVLGAYSLAYRVMLFPLQNLTSVMSRSLYPLMSRKQDEPERIKEMYLKVLTFVASITAPMMAGLAVLREPFVALTFGEKWTLVPSILLWLAPTGFVQSLVSTTGSVFMANGKTQLLMRLGVLGASLQVTAFIIGGQYDVQMMALLYLVANIINAIPAMFYTMRTLNGCLFDLVQLLIAPILCSGIMVVSLLITTQLTKSYINTPISYLLINVLSAAIIYVISYRLIFPEKIVKFVPDRHLKLLFISK
ncbi:MOP flippase family protein [Vibrio alfacsensis]|uniref:MOP flippase family protein n=1 Tax=Vibrio alfacsensis TaxID=1074311 RepID=UPI0040684CC1